MLEFALGGGYPYDAGGIPLAAHFASTHIYSDHRETGRRDVTSRIGCTPWLTVWVHSLDSFRTDSFISLLSAIEWGLYKDQEFDVNGCQVEGCDRRK